MAANDELAARVRKLLSKEKNIEEKKMFGGLAFLLKGKMCVGVDESELIVRVDPSRHEEFMAKPNTREFDLSGKKSIKGWLIVKEKGCADGKILAAWVQEGVQFASSLVGPAKKKAKKQR